MRPASELSESSFKNLDAAAKVQRDQGKAPFAVFDADHTLWSGDVLETLLAFLEWRGHLTMDHPRYWPIPRLADDSLLSYAERLLEESVELGYRWTAEAFWGIPICVLKRHVDELLHLEQPFASKGWTSNDITERWISPPRIYRGQQRLVERLCEMGIDVYIITASLEEIVRMVLYDTIYAYNLPAERVIGLNANLIDETTGANYGTPRQAVMSGIYGSKQFPDFQENYWVFGQELVGTKTWFEGKVVGMRECIHPSLAPLLAAGDSTSDFPLLASVDNAVGGIRLFIQRQLSTRHQLDAIVARQSSNLERGWVVMLPNQLE